MELQPETPGRVCGLGAMQPDVPDLDDRRCRKRRKPYAATHDLEMGAVGGEAEGGEGNGGQVFGHDRF